MKVMWQVCMLGVCGQRAHPRSIKVRDARKRLQHLREERYRICEQGKKEQRKIMGRARRKRLRWAEARTGALGTAHTMMLVTAGGVRAATAPPGRFAQGSARGPDTAL